MLHRFQLVSSVIILFTFTLNAEILNNIGLSLGGGQSFEVEYDYETYSKLSFSLSLSIELFESKYFSLKSFIGYDRKGSNNLYIKTGHIDNTGNLILFDSLVDVKRRSDFICLRILGKIIFLPQKMINPYLLIGPRIDYLIKRTVEDTWLGVEEYDITDKTNRWIYGISSGIGSEFNIKKIILSPYALVNIDINRTKAEYGIEFRSIQYFIALEVAYGFYD